MPSRSMSVWLLAVPSLTALTLWGAEPVSPTAGDAVVKDVNVHAADVRTLSAQKTPVHSPDGRGDHTRARIDCASAALIVLPNVRITSAVAVPLNDSLRKLGRKSHCRVDATIDVETRITALLPDDWNNRFLMGGAGAYVGVVENQYASSVHEGYATVGTDAGHSGFEMAADWALNNPRRIEEYGHRAVHRTAEVTKAIIAEYYGRAPQQSYFIGCSNGGREALMEAQRYPTDFDGIVAIAPAFNFLELTTAFIRNLQAQYPTGNFSAPVVTPAVLKLVATKVTEACDAIDGVRDGTLENPEACTFKFASLPACSKDKPADGCVTRAQRAALTTFNSRMTIGLVTYPGWAFGDEADPEGMEAWMVGPISDIVEMSGRTAPTVQALFATQFFKYFVYGDSAWRYVNFDLARAVRDGAKVNEILSATKTDLSAFRASGGKLLISHGWSDPALSARSTIEYFKDVQKNNTGPESFTRLFLLPGVLHCAGGSGCDDVNYIDVIRRWVERGEAPTRIVARKLDKAKVVKTHPLCAYPMTARYNGTGNINDAAAFSCR